MFASALQKRKAVVLSQSSQPSSQQQQQQQRPLQLSQPQPAAPIARNPITTTASAVVATANSSSSSQHASVVSSATTGQSLSAMLAKRQKIETAQPQTTAISGFTTAKEWSSAAAAATREQPKAAAIAKTRTSPPKAKARAASASKARQQSSEQSDEGVVFELSSKRRVTVRKWRSAVLIDIREYYDDNGVSKPGKKGISLSQDQWRALQRLARSIDEAIGLVEDDSVDDQSLQDVPERISADTNERTIAFTLSSKRRISVRYFRNAVLIDLREFYDDNGVSKPGKKGIALSKQQWRALCASTQEVSDAASQL